MKTEQIVNYRSFHKVLTAPLSIEDTRKAMTKDGKLTTKIVVPLSDIIRGNQDSLNDLVSEKILGTSFGLEDISIEVGGRTTKNEVILRVTADVKNYVNTVTAEEEIGK